MIQLFYYSLSCNTFSFLTIYVQFVIHSIWFGELYSIAVPPYKRGIQTLRVGYFAEIKQVRNLFQVVLLNHVRILFW